MTRTTTQGRGIFALMALAVGLIFLLACTSQPAATSGEGQLPENHTSLGAELATGAQNGNSGIWVSGIGEATAKPDLAILNLGAEALADTVSESRSQAAEAMAATIAVLQREGVALEDIQTRSFNISPRYTRHEVTRCPSKAQDTSTSSQGVTSEETRAAGISQPEGFVLQSVSPKQECYTEFEQVLLGFQVTNQLTVKVRDLENVGAVIDRTSDAGGNLTRFQNVRFTIEDSKVLEDQARESAVKDMMAMAESAPTPILSGEMKVSVTVQGTFQIAGAGQ